jgi:hypothetical protein
MPSFRPSGAQDGDAFQVLFPMLDMLNHKAFADMRWTREPLGLCFSTTEDLRAGDTVWNDYGDKSNEERMKCPIILFLFLLSFFFELYVFLIYPTFFPFAKPGMVSCSRLSVAPKARVN